MIFHPLNGMLITPPDHVKWSGLETTGRIKPKLGDGVALGYEHRHLCIDPLAAEFTDVEPRDDSQPPSHGRRCTPRLDDGRAPLGHRR